MVEKISAIHLANKILERIKADPDDDLAVLARQLLRMHERLTGGGTVIESVCNLLNAEIKWCRNDPENKNIQEDFRIGFIEGLTQAKRLIRAARFLEATRLNLDKP